MMPDDRDPQLQALFANAEEELAGEAFTAQVMAKTRKARNLALIGWVGIGLAVVGCALLLAAPLQDAAHLLMQGLSAPLVTLNDPRAAQMLSPVNNAMILLAVGLLGLRAAYRKLFG